MKIKKFFYEILNCTQHNIIQFEEQNCSSHVLSLYNNLIVFNIAFGSNIDF